MEALVGTYALVLGAAGLMPRIGSGPGWGGRAFGGFAAIIIMLFVGQLGFGLDYRILALILAPLAGIGLIFWFHQGRSWLIDEFLTHPAFVLPVLLAMLVGLHGGNVDYLPLAWDEYSNWLSWAKQYLEYGKVVDPRIVTGVMGYTPGWPLVLALPGLWHEEFGEGGALMAFSLMHVVLLGLVYDALVGRLWRAEHRPGFAKLAAWGVILVLLAVEASWKLVPINLLIEEPQTYCLVACTVLAFGWRDDAGPAWRVALYLGLACALGYLVKGAMLVFAPSAFILFAAYLMFRGGGEPARWRQMVARDNLYAWVVLAVAPLLVVAVWSVWGTHPGDCLSQPALAFAGAWDRIGETERTLDLWHRYWKAVFRYLATYKLFLSAAAVLCFLAVAAVDRFARVVLIALVVYSILYSLSLFAYHLDCLGPYYFDNLNSIGRFTRVPLRVFHVVGPVLLVHVFAVRLRSIPVGRRLTLAIATLVFMLGAYQVTRVQASLRSVASRADADPVLAGQVRMVRAATLAIAKYHPGTDKAVVFIDQGGQGFAPHIARYFGRGVLRSYPAASWGEKPINVWMQPTNPVEMKRLLLGAAIVVPMHLDGWMTQILHELGAEATCLLPPFGLLFPDAAMGRLRCIANGP